MRKIIENVLIVIAAVSGIVWMASGAFMTVYFKAGMIAEYGEYFTTMVEYCFAFGWIVPIGALSYLDVLFWRTKRENKW
jgi:hypothetical protein